MSLLRSVVAAAALAAGSMTVIATAAAPAQAAAVSCSSSGTWRQGEMNVYWFDVDQGDSQLIVGPTGKTMLIDLGERAWNSSGTGTKAYEVAQQIKSICGTGSNPVALDYVMVSHQHLDHIGYAHVPEDGTSTIGNGLWQLLSPASSGGLDFTVGTLYDRDGGTWTDANSNNTCEVGTATAPAPEIAWHNVGTTSQTARRFICWLYGPAGQADRANIAGHVVQLTNSMSWPSIDLGGGATSVVVNANGKDTMQANGTTPVSGDHSADSVPPSENDYSIAVKTTYGAYKYATAGDSDGEYSTSADGYTYNNIEAGLVSKFGNLNYDTVRANHHGSGHSSSDAYINSMDPETTLISCGNNSYGHPANRTLNAFRNTGADIYLTNNPCDTTDTTGAAIDYSGTFNNNGTVHLYTTNAGADYTIDYDAGTKSYVTGAGGGGGSQGDPTLIKVNEFSPSPATGNEWIELYNPTASAVDVSGYKVDDVAGGGGAPKTIPTGTVIPAGGRWVYEFASGFLNNTGSDAARYTSPGGVELDAYTYSIGTTQYDKVFHRVSDGGSWCATFSTNVTKGTANPATCP
jgi:beta-lactamase superfamily II metal-dependent hydrolase